MTNYNSNSQTYTSSSSQTYSSGPSASYTSSNELQRPKGICRRTCITIGKCTCRE